MNMHLPFNKYFWLALVAIVFAGGMTYGQIASLNDTLDEHAAAVAASSVMTQDRVQIRHIDLELQMLLEEPFEDDFTEVDDALEDL